jgi:hypothetical protein
MTEPVANPQTKVCLQCAKAVKAAMLRFGSNGSGFDG